MSVAVVDFQWPVSKEGHRLIEMPDKPLIKKLITTGQAVADLDRRRERYRWFKPFLDTPTLFRVFADWGDSDADILAFTNEFGLFSTITPQAEHPVGRRRMWGASVERWRKLQRNVRVLLREWELVERGDEPGLLALETGERRNAVETMDDPRSQMFIPPMFATTLPTLTARAAYRIMWLVNSSMIRVEAAPELSWDSDSERFQLGVSPGSLEGVIWIQIAEYVSGLRNYRACAVCGKHLEISTEQTGHRTNIRYCSNACRFKAYRRRKSESGRKRRDGLQAR